MKSTWKTCITGCAVLAVVSTASAGVGPLSLTYDVYDIGSTYQYDFTLTLTNGDGSWTPGQGWGWLVFGDQESAPSPIADFVGDSSSMPAGPWTFFTTTYGYHNGAVLGDVTEFWVPTTVGDSIAWSGTSSAFVEQGAMQFSTLLTTGGAVASNFDIATLGIPTPGALALLGLAGLFTFGRRRRTA